MDVSVAPIEKARTIVRERERTGQASITAEHMVKTLVETGDSGKQRIIAAPLDRLYAEKKLTKRQFEAGDRFREDAQLSAMDGAISSADWNAVGGNFGPRVPKEFSSQWLHDKRAEYRTALAFLGPDLEMIADLILVHEYPLETVGKLVFRRSNKRDATTAAHIAAQIVLNTLARFYERSRR